MIKEPNTKSLLKTRRYGLFWFSSLLSNIGTWMQQVAQPWIMLTISHSSFLVGLDSFALNAPGWILILWGGVLADRVDRKKVILFFQGIQFFAIILLVILIALDLIQPWMIILISLCVGITDSLSMPSFQSIVPSLVKAEEIPQVVSLNSIQFNLSRALGPAIAGVTMAHFGAVACFGANALSFIPFFLSIFWIYPSHPSKSNSNQTSISKSSVLETFQILFKKKQVRTQILTLFFTSLFAGPVITFCPVLIKNVFTGQLQDFGNASTSFGIGGLVGALVAFFAASKFKSKSPEILGIILGLTVLGIAFNRSTIVLLILMVFAGGLLTLVGISANSNLQFRATDQTRGRYISLFQLALRGGVALGGLVTGVLTSQWGVVTAFAINAILSISLQLLLLLRK